MDQVHLVAGDWAVDAYMARTFTDRLLGNTRVPTGAAVAIRSRSVHSFGQREQIEMVALDSRMRVVAARTLRPNRVALVPTARMIVELPAGARLPALMVEVAMSHV